jgi:hypothetical protein
MRPLRSPLRLALMALAVFAVAGCGSETITVVQSTPAPKPSPSAATSNTVELAGTSSPTSCTLYLSGDNATITFASLDLQVSPECQQFITGSAQGGNLWSNNPSTSSSGGASQAVVCSLLDTSGRVTATVSDTGGDFQSEPVCTALIGAGWTEQSSGSTADPNTAAEDSGTYCNSQDLDCTAQGSTVAGSPSAGETCLLGDGTPGVMNAEQAVCERP